jgi:hypothetical protein
VLSISLSKIEYNIKLKYFFKALEIKEKVLGAGHKDIKWKYKYIARIYENLGDKGKFERYCRKADCMK